MRASAVEAAEAKRRAFQSKREGGRGKREERRKADEGKEDQGLFTPLPTDTSTATTKTTDTSTTATTKTTDPSSQAYFSAIPSHLTPTHPWFLPATSTHTSLSSAREAGIWTYPSTPLERARCATYRKVWTEGMFMGQGVKFGGEFLVYPGTSLAPPPPLTIKQA